MPAAVFHPDDGLYNPDLLKMPENPRHRTAIDAIGLAASVLLDDRVEMFRDMNWYPSDGGNAVAPDIMVLPAGAFVAPPDAKPGDSLNSYRQDKTGGPPAVVVVELPSESDGYNSLRTKLARYAELGTTAYVVGVDESQTIERFAPSPKEAEAWITAEGWNDRPIPELGGLRLRFDDGLLTVIMPDGTTARSDHQLVDRARQQADELQQRLFRLEQQVAAYEQRAAGLERQLREAGIEPDDPVI